jgi:hypothetical protein
MNAKWIDKSTILEELKTEFLAWKFQLFISLSHKLDQSDRQFTERV